MNGRSKEWTENWVNQKHERMYPNFHVPGYGSDYEFATTYWMASLLDPMRERFKEGVSILDYGCGGGRLFNFMTGYLKDFTYYGAEPEESREMKVAKGYFEKDPRSVFLSCEDSLKSKDAMSCDAVILGSIFTHLLEDHCEKILNNLLPVIENGGMIIFSALFKLNGKVRSPGAHGMKDCYGIVYQRNAWIEEIKKKYSFNIEEAGDFETGHGVIQQIFRMT